MKHGLHTLVLISFLVPRIAGGFSGYKIESTGACASTEISEAVKNVLQPQGLRVTGDSGALCEVWLRKVIPQKAGSSGTDYSTLANGTFVGVITYSGKAGDFRGQAIKAGTYTLRYQTIPQDGNHLGVSPTPDFFLLTAAGIDKNADAALDYTELIKLARQASGTSHPHPLNLLAPASGGATGFKESGDGHWALEAKTKAQPSGGGAEVDFPIALVLIGKAEG
jgi:hypothetical protein